MSFALLVGCGRARSNYLTYGTLANQDLNTLVELDTADLYEKAIKGETFLLAAYQGEASNECTCWSSFQNIIVNYMNTYHELVYVYNAQRQDTSVKDLNIAAPKNSSDPYLYIFKGKKKLVDFSYNNIKDKAIFEDMDASTMYSNVHKFVERPSMFYVDDAYLSNNLKTSKEAMVIYVRNKCSDCKYVIPNVLIPYINSHKMKIDFWLFDMQPYYDLSNSETASEEEKAQYQAIKDKYQLSASSNSKFGYLNGVVPTAHYYKDGELKGAAVYFNDVVTAREDGSVYISDSFYSHERINNLVYLVDYHDWCIAKNVDITSEALQTRSGEYFWAQEKAAAFYTPIWNKFLNYYLK